MKKIKINDITIRDIFQHIDSKYINRKILDRIIEQLCKINFDSYEILGGSAFEKMIESSFNETPFKIIYDIKNRKPELKLQALIGAKNIVGMEVYPPSVIRTFIKKCCSSGIDRFRIYDSLNDLENFKYTVSEVIDNGCYCQGTLIYDDFQDNDFYVESSKKLLSLGCREICIEDVESILLPNKTSELFKSLKKNIDSNFFLSLNNLRGLQILNCFNACISGCSGIDLSFLPSSYNDSSPSIFPFLLSLKDTDYYVDIDHSKIMEIFEWFKKNIYPLIKNELLYLSFIFSNKNRNLLPKWLLSNINYQLSEIGENSKINLVLEEVFKIKNEIGNPSLSSPVGQIIGSQAILNSIISDSRWEITNDEIKKLVSGYYGKLPRIIDLKIKEKIFNNSDDQTSSNIEVPDDNVLEQCREELKDITDSPEDILSYLFFPEKTLRILKNKKFVNMNLKKGQAILQDEEIQLSEISDTNQITGLNDIDIQKLKDITNLVETSNIDEIKLEIEGVKISINKKSKQPAFTGKESDIKSMPNKEKHDFKDKEEFQNNDEKIFEVKSPIVGTFYCSPSPGAPPFVNVGTRVNKGDVLCIIEAMKLMNKINSEYSGTVVEILLKNEEPVEYDQPIMKIKP